MRFFCTVKNFSETIELKHKQWKPFLIIYDQMPKLRKTATMSRDI